MPCNCDYLEPNEYEREAEKLLPLVYYALNELTQKELDLLKKKDKECARILNDFIKTNPSYQKDVYNKDAKRIANEYTRLLCYVMDNLAKERIEKVAYNAKIKESRNLADWWENHQEEDKKRIAKEKKEKQATKDKKVALSKLSEKDKKALNIKQ